jgi:plasmid maintenance system antidote protein VapI
MIDHILRREIKRAGHSLLYISKQSKVPYATLHPFAAGKIGLTTRNADKLAKFFGLALRKITSTTHP